MSESSSLLSYSYGLDVATILIGAGLIWTGVKFYLQPLACISTYSLFNDPPFRSWRLIPLSGRYLWLHFKFGRRTHRISNWDRSEHWRGPLRLDHDLPGREKELGNIPGVLVLGGDRG